MADVEPDRKTDTALVPTMMIRALLVLILTVIALVFWARVSDRPLAAQAPKGEVLQERVIQMSAELDGSARVTDADGGVIAEYATGEGVFISTIARVMDRERMKVKGDPQGPFVLRLRAGDRLSLFDPETGRETELVSFGDDNVGAFRALLAAE
ncbi:MAG: photosynthetic complex assembly protein PuhC [Pseudomonadota bacterium]